MDIIENISKLVKPITPTPSTLRNYNISFFDQKYPNMNVPLILYYSTSHKDQNDVQTNVFNHLEISLSKTLVDFYPLAGRYMRHGSFIDCCDQGALYIQAKAKFQLSEFLGQELEFKLHRLDDFLPCDVGKVGESNPLLSIKVTSFMCGGVALGMCISHKFADMATICTFINNWATRSRELGIELEQYSPIFSAPYRIPNTNLFKNEDVPTFDPNCALRVFIFKGTEVTKLREKLMSENNVIRHRPSKVQLVETILWKAFVDMDNANEQWKSSFVYQGINLRNIIIPKAPENFCGNFCTFASTQVELSNMINHHVLLKLLHDSINKIKSYYPKALSHSEKDYEVLSTPFLKHLENNTSNDLNIYAFSSWCKFSFYTADFGWGKPVWRSTANMKLPHTVILMDDEDGDGVEAWVHLDQKEMYVLEQDPNLQAYCYPIIKKDVKM